MMERPLLLPLVALIAGIGAATYYGLELSPWLILPGSLSFLSGCAFKRHAYCVCGVAIISLLWGNHSSQSFVAPSFPGNHVARNISDAAVSITGIVYQRPQTKEQVTRLSLDVDSLAGGAATGRLLVSVKSSGPSVTTGDRIRLLARIREVRTMGIPGEHDISRSLATKGIFATSYLADASAIELLEERVAYPFKRRIDDTAFRLRRFIETSVQHPESGVLQALLVGDRSGISSDLEDLYARSGVNHILSISGFHVGILAIALYLMLAMIARRSERLLLYNIRWGLSLATLPVIVWYLLISGAAPATIRSVLMIAACFFALLLERETDPVNTLAFAAYAMLAVHPGILFDITFQLSFIALWGIMVLTPLFMGFYGSRSSGVSYHLTQFTAVSAAAIIATLLPVAYSFHRVSVVGLLSNFVVVPLLGYGAVLTGFSALLLAPLMPDVAALLLKLAATLVSWSNSAMVLIDRIPQLPRFTPTLLEVALSIAVLFVVTLVRSNRKRLFSALVVIAIAISARHVQKEIFKVRVRVFFFSVGHGDSTFISFPDGSNMLVDGGGSLHESGFDVGRRIIAPALWRLGVDRIDRLVLSHPHPDHVKGLEFVARNFTIGEFWESGYSYSSPSYLRLKETLKSSGVPVRTVNSSIPSFKAGGAIINPLAPPAPSEGYDTIAALDEEVNEESMVFRLSHGQFSMLFTGDAGFESESRLIRESSNLQSTVLKVAHHGSRYSSSIPFLKGVEPRLSLISAGYRNSFHLPAPETVADLAKTGSDIHRTDLHGTIELIVTPATGSFVSRKYHPAQIDTY